MILKKLEDIMEVVIAILLFLALILPNSTAWWIK